MSTADVFRRRALEAEERAAYAVKPEERKVWSDIADEYRRFAKQIEADEDLP